MNKLFLTVTIGPDYRLLPRFLKYYRNLGIKDFLVQLNTSDPTPRSFLQKQGINTIHSWFEPFSEDRKQFHERFMIIKNCSSEDWVLYADLDEFQHYPLRLETHIKYCEDHGIDYLEGKLTDRVAEEGILAEIPNGFKLEDLFPYSGNITNKLLKAWDKKIVLARAKLIVGGGHHLFLDHKTHKPKPYNSKVNRHSTGIEVHHFKWDIGAISRMERYSELTCGSLYFWKKEISRFLEHYHKNAGISITDKRFKFKKVSKFLNI